MIAGTCAGFLGSFATSRVLKQNKNLALISGLMTGVLTGQSFILTPLYNALCEGELKLTRNENATRLLFHPSIPLDTPR